MSKTKSKVRRQILTLFCALLLFGQNFASAAYADREQNVNISYTVTEDMLPKPVSAVPFVVRTIRSESSEATSYRSASETITNARVFLLLAGITYLL